MIRCIASATTVCLLLLLVILIAATTLTTGCVFVPGPGAHPTAEAETRTWVRFEPSELRELEVSVVVYERRVMAEREGHTWVSGRAPHAVVAILRDARAASVGMPADPLVEASFSSGDPDPDPAPRVAPSITCRDDALVVDGVACPLSRGDLVVVAADADGRARVLAQTDAGELDHLAAFGSNDAVVAAVGRALRERAVPGGASGSLDPPSGVLVR